MASSVQETIIELQLKDFHEEAESEVNAIGLCVLLPDESKMLSY